MTPLLRNAQTWYAELDESRRRRLFAALAAALVAIVGAIWWSQRIEWEPVLSDRRYDDLLVAAGSLDRVGIKYQIDDDRLMVAAGELGAARDAIGNDQDVPGLGDVGDLGIGTSHEAQEWAFMRAREGDIAKMINGIDGVIGSQVHIVPREQSLFLDDDARAATASVFVRTAPGIELDTSQVKAIAHLVANAVEGLSPRAVTIADDKGQLLFRGDGDDGDDVPRTLLDYRTRVESRFERAVTQSLLPVFGTPAAFTVTASVDLDLTDTQVTTRRIDPETQAVLSQASSSRTDARQAPGGVPGVDANLPERGPIAATSGTTARLDDSTTTTNYAYPTVDEVERRPAGGIARASVAVQIDLSKLTALDPTADLESRKAEIEATVRAAVGYDESRGDVVNISFVPFAPRSFTETPAPTALASVSESAPTAIVALAIIGALLLVARPLIAAAVRPPEPVPAPVAASEKESEEPHDDLQRRLRDLVENYENVDAADLNRLVDRESRNAAEVVRLWTRQN